MTPSPVELSVPALLQDHAWLAGLARALVRDPDAAQDLAQATWLQALRSRAQVAAPRAWLAQIARNQAKRAARTEQRRARREREALPQDDAEAASAVAERFEVQRKVVEAVAGLEQPFRDTVLLHWFQGLSLVEVARTSGVPEGTVRWRLHRAHELLRERLASVWGERDWRPALALLALPMGRTGVSAATLAAVAGVLLLASGLAYALWPDSAAAPSGVALASAGEARATPTPAPGAREGITPATSSPAPAASPAASARPATRPDEAAMLRAVLVDAHTGAPVRGTLGIGAVRFGNLSFEFSDLARWLPAGVSDAAGSAALPVRVTPAMLAELPAHLRPEVGAAWQLSLTVQADGYAPESRDVAVAHGDDLDLGRIALAPVGELTGRVLDPQGKPLGGVEVCAVAPPFGSMEFDTAPAGALRTTTANWLGAGTFRVAGVRRGPVLVWARKAGFAIARVPFTLAGGSAAVPDITLRACEPGTERQPDLQHRLRVAVRAQGQPRPSARVQVRSLGRNGRIDRDTTVDQDGVATFAWLGDASEAHVAVSAWDREHAFGVIALPELDSAVGEVALDLPVRAPLRVGVVDPQGQPIASAKANFTAGALEVWAQPSAAGLLLAGPPTDARLTVVADGFAPVTQALAANTVPGTEFTVTLHRYPTLRGRVLADGRPVADARVTLLAPTAPFARDGFRTDFEAAGSAPVAADGSFVLACPTELPVRLRASAKGFAAATAVVRADAETEIALQRGVRVQGRVHDVAGRARPRAIVALNDGLGAPRTVRADGEGRFSFSSVAAGRYELRVNDEEIRADGHSRATLPGGLDALPANLEVGTADVTRDLCVDACRLAVTLQRGALREPLWRASLRSLHDDHILTVAEDRDGSGAFALSVATPGHYVLAVSSLGGPFGDVRHQQRVVLQAGEQAATVSLAVAPCTLELPGAAGKVARLRQVRDGATLTAWLTRTADGRYVAPLAPGGDCELFDGSGLDRPLGNVVVPLTPR